MRTLIKLKVTKFNFYANPFYDYNFDKIIGLNYHAKLGVELNVLDNGFCLGEKDLDNLNNKNLINKKFT